MTDQLVIRGDVGDAEHARLQRELLDAVAQLRAMIDQEEDRRRADHQARERAA